MKKNPPPPIKWSSLPPAGRSATSILKASAPVHIQQIRGGRPGYMVPPPMAGVRWVASPTIQRMEDSHINKRKKQRQLDQRFLNKHVRIGGIIDESFTARAFDTFRGRALGNVTQNTMIIMNSYQIGLFCEQDHNDYGDSSYGRRFESTTQFEAIDISSDGAYKIYSAAKFSYAATYSDEEGLWIVNHMFGITSGTIVREGSFGTSKHTVFEE
jgi:hypothetical protein